MKREGQLNFPGLPPKSDTAYVLTLGGEWLELLYVDRVEDLLPGMLEALRQEAARNEFQRSPEGDLLLPLYGRKDGAEDLKYLLVITNRAAKEIWPTH